MTAWRRNSGGSALIASANVQCLFGNIGDRVPEFILTTAAVTLESVKDEQRLTR
jgi:hypothetical protein